MNLFDLDKINTKIGELEAKTIQEGFWNDSKTSGTILQEMKTLKDKAIRFTTLSNEVNNLLELNDLLLMEEDSDLAYELLKNTKILGHNLEKLEIETLLSRKI